MCKRQQNRSQCRGGLVGPRLLVDRELKVRKPRQPFFHTENAQARDQRAGRKRGDGEARDTEFGRRQSPETSDSLRRRGIVMLPSEFGIDVNSATRDWLAAQTIDDLVTASGGLYVPPAKFRRPIVTRT